MGIAENFEKNGFALGEKVLADEQCEQLCKEIEYLVENRNALDQNRMPVNIASLKGMETPVWQIVDIYMASDLFTELVHLPAITKVVSELAKAKELRLWHDQVQYKPSFKGGENHWHQDWPYWGILDRPTQVTAWIALDDAAEDNGCMSMVKGSHKWGNQIQFLHSFNHGEGTPFFDIPKEFEHGQIEQALCPVPKGYVHYHHGLTWHGSHANKSGRPRRAIALHYMTEETCYNAEGNHIMEKYVKVNHGEKMSGDAFPLVYANGVCVESKSAICS